MFLTEAFAFHVSRVTATLYDEIFNPALMFVTVPVFDSPVGRFFVAAKSHLIALYFTVLGQL